MAQFYAMGVYWFSIGKSHKVQFLLISSREWCFFASNSVIIASATMKLNQNLGTSNILMHNMSFSEHLAYIHNKGRSESFKILASSKVP